MSDDELGEYDASGDGGGRGNGGMIAGLLAAVGAGGLGIAGDCARLGARSARAVDDVAIAGSRAGGLLDDGARVGARGLGDDLVRGGKPGAWVDDAGRPRLIPHPGGGLGEEAKMLESLREFAVDAGFEVVSYEFDDDVLGPGQPLPERYPLTRGASANDLDADAWAWKQLSESSATKAPFSGPWIFTGRNEGDALIIGDETIDVRALASTCRARGATCVFVGCTSNCSGESERLFERAGGRDRQPLDHFTIEYAAARLKSSDKPNFVAVATNELTIMRR